MSKIDYEMLQQKISLYDYIVNNCLISQNNQNFNQIKEELFQELLRIFKRVK
jgi:hypothetical protein